MTGVIRKIPGPDGTVGVAAEEAPEAGAAAAACSDGGEVT